MAGGCQGKVKSQSELDIGGRVTCSNIFFTFFYLIEHLQEFFWQNYIRNDRIHDFREALKKSREFSLTRG